MTSPPVDTHDLQNPFQLSKLVMAAKKLAEKNLQAEHTQNASSAVDDKGQSLHLEISTKQIIDLITRFHLKSLRYDALESLPKSLMSPKEKEFVDFLRRNPQVFDRIAGLDQEPEGISIKDIKIASSLAGDTLTLSDQDIEYLQQNPLKAPVPSNFLPQKGTPLPAAKNARLSQLPQSTTAANKALTLNDLTTTLKALSPSGQLNYATLLAINPQESGLEDRSLRGLQFLQSAPARKVLQKLLQASNHNGIITVETLRILTSLLWNPSVYGLAPMLFMKARKTEEDLLKPVDDLEILDDDDHRKGLSYQRFAPTLRLQAHCIQEICHNINPFHGHVTLVQLRQYKPRNTEEERALNLLQQSHVFEALAGLDDDHRSLSDDDIRLALEEGVILLYDPYLTLVIQP